MAKAYINESQSNKFNKTVVLELTPREAVFIQSLVGNVIGTVSGYRGYADKIFDALVKFDIPTLGHEIWEGDYPYLSDDSSAIKKLATGDD